tara:strand:+ start:109 stop:537 length:429 start_codon:yes stop_codon:yes gene_type:complete
MLITKENVIEYLTNNLVHTSMIYPIGKEKHFILLNDLNVKLSDSVIVNIPKGFIFDGSSVPRIFWFAFPPYGNFFFAAMIHDYLYQRRYRSKVIGVKRAKEFADKEMLIWSNVLNNRNFGKRIDNYIRYYAVKFFGMKQYLD